MTNDHSERINRLRTELCERLLALEIALRVAEERFADTKVALDSLQAELRARSNVEVFDTSKIVTDARAELNRVRAGMRELVTIISADDALTETLGSEILRIMTRMERQLLT